MTDDQRADYDNLILLCPEHHQATSDFERYTVESLKMMKREHESAYLNLRVRSNPSMLANVVNAIAEMSLELDTDYATPSPFDPRDKLLFNAIRINYSIIEEYKVYHTRIDHLYNELERAGSIKKERLLANIRQLYLQIKGEVVGSSTNPVQLIRQNSDLIIDKVFDQLCESIDLPDAYQEDVLVGARLIMVDAFIRCKILEEPRAS